MSVCQSVNLTLKRAYQRDREGERETEERERQGERDGGERETERERDGGERETERETGGERHTERERDRQTERDKGGRCSSVSGNDWLVSASRCHLHQLLLPLVEEEGKRRRRCKRGEEERENLYPLYLWASSPAVQEPAFQECLIFKSLISAPVLSIAVLYFYISFACSSSNLATSIFFSPFFLLLGGVQRYEHACTREWAFILLQSPSCVLYWRYLYLVSGIYSVKKYLVSLDR